MLAAATGAVAAFAGGKSYAVADVPAAATGVDAAGGWSAVATRESVLMLKGENVSFENKCSYSPTCVAVSRDGTQVAVGGADKKIHVYDNNGGKLAEQYAVEHGGALCAVAFSPSGTLIAGGDADKDVIVWKGREKVSKDFGHSARVDKVRFSPDGAHLATASLDSSFILWNIDSNKRVAEVRNAHVGGVKDLVWVDGNNILTTGQDVLIKSWVFNA